MALTSFALRLLAPYFKNARVLALGYPDLLVSGDEAGQLLGFDPRRIQKSNPTGPLAHKLKQAFLPETVECFRLAGATAVRCVDVKPSRGVEEIVDLNYAWYDGQYDLVLDAGTIEHCANIGQALMNAADAVKPGGYIFHSPPVTMVNHGFYNVCPTLLHDFYTQNGWTVAHLSGFRAHRNYDSFSVEPTRRGRVAEESALYFLARRPVGDGAPELLRWPTQTKYLTKETT